MNKSTNDKNSTKPQLAYDRLLPAVYPCKKISSVGYYHPEHCVCWEGYDPETGHADFHGFSKKEIKWLIDDSIHRQRASNL
jgi:hypothetical protein